MENLFKDKKLLVIIAVCVVIYILYKNNKEHFPDSGSQLSADSKIDLVSMCSSDCCSSSNYPVPHDTVRDARTIEKLKSGELIGTNMMCDGITGSGCICATRGQVSTLASRAGNAYSV